MGSKAIDEVIGDYNTTGTCIVNTANGTIQFITTVERRSSLLVVAEAHSVLGLVNDRIRVLVLVAADSIAHALSSRLLAVGLQGGGSRVSLALEHVAGLLGHRLLRVGLGRGTELIGH
jgi:hypothetical protein